VSQEIERVMALDWREFVRLLPIAVGDKPYEIRNRAVEVRLSDNDQLTIAVGPTAERRIAAIALPATPVTFTFEGGDTALFQSFMERFERYFQRGGG
jgi:hypothetical protein